ncbi:efflux RND transporter periplasmic adaptor subunit [Frigoriglobus tundricola]|uniref:efflux RND transporter periplasmic adaptor subunit n=1 Tax=Frigoriglobus tundricola TaxID=2774151 RepID=UPI00148EB291|nr:efflux RND transporter periplasmic adaptor subunit [Frigoriglobus tundricola]
MTSCAIVGCRGAKPAPEPPPPPMVTVARPATAEVQSYYEYNGYLEAVETVEIRARVKGFLTEVALTKPDSKIREGDEVKTGTQLYTIDPREYQAAVAKSEADILKAKADIINAKAQVALGVAEETRQRDAFGKGIGSRTDLDKAIATLASNQAAVDVAVANEAAAKAAKQTAVLQLEYTDIRSPIDGRISRTLVTQGNLVGQNESTLLTTIVRVDPLYVYFDAPERDFVEAQRAAKSPQGQATAALPVQVGVATEVGFPHSGVIDFQENRVDTGTGTVRVRGRISNPLVPPGHARLLYPGLYARVRVPNGERKKQLVLPEEALMTGQEGRFVYVIGPDNKVVKRTVTVGANVWRDSESGPDAKSKWVLHNSNPKPPAGGAPGGGGAPAQSAPPADAPVRSIVAIEKGLEPTDQVIVVGLQKARPGAPVSPDVWELKGPPQAK